MNTKKGRRRPSSSFGAPFLRRIKTLEEKCDPSIHPFNIPAFRNGIDLHLDTNVTFVVGENGSGKSFLALFANRFEQGIYILDEPEAALSLQRQLSFLRIIYELETPGHAQFLVATHSPILLSYPGATLFSFDGGAIEKIEYQDTDHYKLTRDFLNAPERYFRHLFENEPR